MAWKSFSVLCLTTWPLVLTLAQTISIDTSVPPLQWINLTGLLQGSSSPPPLKNAAIGYDEPSRSVIIFGGESASGLAQSQTFLLNLDSLTCRQGFLVIGGEGSDGNGLTDEYDFNNQFWSEVNMSPGGPLPRWGASGGIDISTPPIQDPVVPGPNNTFYLSGGYDGISPSSFSDVWRLNISGTLSSNLPNDTNGSWDHLLIGNLPSKFNATGTVVGHQVVVTGGCTSDSPSGICAEQESYVIDTQRLSETSTSVCPAPRINPVLVQNTNSVTSTFASQVLLLLGTIDRTIWDDDNGLNDGEVAILDIQTGTWSRIIPSGDPGSSGIPTFPSPREGSAAFSYPLALVGNSRNISSDTFIFGGQDSSGNILSEIWLLRFGNGHLQTGINANGAGVNVTYMTKCASLITPPSTATSSSATITSSSIHPSPSPSDPLSPSNNTPSSSFEFNVSVIHKILAPVSLAIFQAAFLVFRFVSPFYQTGVPTVRATYGSAVLSTLAYGSGIAGFAIAFTSLSSQSSGSMHLLTGHGIAGVTLFSLLYVVLPALLLAHAFFTRRRAPIRHSEDEKDNHTRSPSLPEGIETYEWPSSRSAPQSLHQVSSSPTSPRQRTSSWGPSSMLYRSQEGRMSSDSESGPPSPKRGFEVTNRPSRTRKTSSLAHPAFDMSSEQLRDIDWLQRRRSLNAVGELDYALTQVRREQLSTPATTDGLVAATTLPPSQPQLEFPTPSEIAIHVIVQGLLLGITILTLVYLWSRAPKAGFAIFLAWTIIFYAIMIIFATHLRPDRSILAALCGRLKSPAQNPSSHPTPSTSPEGPLGPYVHQPSRRLATAVDDVSLSQGGLRTAGTDVDEQEDVDDDTRQRIMEEEMGRRDVSIVTIPKRKLWIANP
ncbi:hypothetical protein C0991_001221 [Blastosporella zonata]|nr:hypothetical protein C0991_001221 [Blastosporella zonata]